MSDIPSTPVPPMPQTPNESQARMWHMWAHLSMIAGFVIPFGQILGPLVVWQMKKAEFPSVEAHAKSAMNFHITVVLVVIVLLVLGVVLSTICIGFAFFFVIPIVLLASLIFSVIAAIKANEGKDYNYPWSLNLVK